MCVVRWMQGFGWGDELFILTQRSSERKEEWLELRTVELLNSASLKRVQCMCSITKTAPAEDGGVDDTASGDQPSNSPKTELGIIGAEHLKQWWKYNILTLNVQKHALLMTSDPAECLTVKATQVSKPHTADGQHRLAMATAYFKAAVLTLKTTTQLRYSCSHDNYICCFSLKTEEHEAASKD